MLKTKKLEKLNRLVLKYYIKHLEKSSRAKEYLYARISKDVAKNYCIGYAPNGGLINYLNKYNVPESLAKEAGLVLIDYDGNAFERFANRIIFPIINAGRILGFGGRTLSIVTPNNPKYINSKASILYNKSEVLYGLWRARKSICKFNYGFLVEGYFDVLSLATYKIYNSFAVCGTALTKDQVNLLKRYTNKIYILLDGDEAGQLAAKKAKQILKKKNIYAGRLILPKDTDPDEFIKKYGKKALNELKIKK